LLLETVVPDAKHPPITLDQFLQLVLPTGESDWTYWVEWNTSAGKHIQRQCKDLNTVSLEIRRKSVKKLDTWFGVGAFGDRRNAHSVKAKLCFYADFDCGPGKPYATKLDALAAIAEAVERGISNGGIPQPTIIIDSGHGIHLYWVLEETLLDSGRWKRDAKRLHNMMCAGGLHPDAKVTSDIARILRAPETFNNKDPQSPTKCVVSEYNPDAIYDIDTLELLLPVMPGNVVDDGTVSQSSAAAKLQSLADLDDLISGVDTGPFSRLDDAGKQAVVGTMLQCISKPEYLDDYMEWLKVGKALHDASQMCSAADADKEWKDIWDTWSQQGKNYQADAIDEKWDGQFVGDKLNNIHFGTLVYMAKKEGFVFPNAVHQVEYPEGYIAVDFGTVRQGEEGEPGTLVCYAHFRDVSVHYDPAIGDMLSATLFFPETKRTFPFETNMLAMNAGMGDNSFAAHLARAGVLTAQDKNRAREVAYFVKAFMDKVAASTRVEKSIAHFGWVESGGRTGFSACNKVFWDDGTQSCSNVPGASLRELFTPKGSLGQWREAAQLLVDQGRPCINTIVAASFGAPLIKFTGIKGLLFSVVSPESGTGKSTAIKAANGVWVQPVEGTASTDDTVNAVVRGMEVRKNLPAFWDEIRVRDQAKQFVKLIFQLGQGKGKARMNSNASLQKVGSWETLSVAASNESLLALTNEIVGSTDAGGLRVVEFQVPELEQTDEVTRLSAYFDATFPQHHGHAGAIYAEWLAKHAGLAERLTVTMRERLAAKVNAVSAERFWVAGFASVLAGAVLAERAGLLKFDIPALLQFAEETIAQLRIDNAGKSAKNSAINMVNAFIQAHVENGIVTNDANFPGIKGRPRPVDILHPSAINDIREPLCWQHAETPALLLLNVNMFEKFMQGRNESPNATLAQLAKMGAVSYPVTGVLGKGSVKPSRVRCRMIGIDTSAGSPFHGLLNV
jgi:hypothetical protein